MKKENEKNRLKKAFKRLFKSMDFVCDNYLNKEGVKEEEIEVFADIYQQLGLAWEHLGLQCKHWDGYRPRAGTEKKYVLKAVELGLAESIGFCPKGDEHGFTIENSVEKEAWALTQAGILELQYMRDNNKTGYETNENPED